jgi:hypothetical protein
VDYFDAAPGAGHGLVVAGHPVVLYPYNNTFFAGAGSRGVVELDLLHTLVGWIGLFAGIIFLVGFGCCR